MKLAEYIEKELKLVDFKIINLVDRGINTNTELRKHTNHYQLMISLNALKKLDLIKIEKNKLGRMVKETINLNMENPIIKRLMEEI